MDRLKGVEYFKRIYELGSFTAAANELQCSSAVISKYVRFLESWTGAKLINRNTRTISFTDEGERFYRYCVSITGQTNELLDAVTDTDNLSGELVVASPVSLSIAVLGPIFIRFQKENPSLSIRLQMSDQLTDLVGSGVDLAIRGIEAPADSSLIATRLGALDRILVASPGYLRNAGEPTTIEQLRSHKCLVYSLSSDANRWEFMPPTGSEEPVSIEVTGPLIADNSMILVEAAKEDMGIAMLPRAYIEKELRNGSLQQLTLDAYPVPRSIYAMYSDRRYLPRRARKFIDFIRQSL
ncbi:LysR family transcriptional regulator [Marinobacter sp. TBZ242]|uniref:LysR family transcriptional regulator n=1 Tax=Marinobacter azerbaijanicus TaxID=3050455 RepID=A0ABT7IK18_9GAMM|nr:LysR family transcriptional regulator [Marinobacter sp. TBZ242]MDL0433488.1 LysR family transcriptional regulator [Marinobacter sp. TBZ242]